MSRIRLQYRANLTARYDVEQAMNAGELPRHYSAYRQTVPTNCTQ